MEKTLTPHQLAFLVDEMRAIKEDRGRPDEERNYAAAIMGTAEAELQWEARERQIENRANS